MWTGRRPANAGPPEGSPFAVPVLAIGIVCLVLLTGSGCVTPDPAPAVYSPPSGADIWLAGDSIAAVVYRSLDSAPRVYNATHGGNGFVRRNDGTIAEFTFARMDSVTPSASPSYVVVQGGANDHHGDIDAVFTAMDLFRIQLELRGIRVIWLTTPVGTYQDLPEWLPQTNDWMRSQPHIIDCDLPTVRAAGFEDGIHPTALGYERYADCIDAQLDAAIAGFETAPELTVPEVTVPVDPGGGA